MQQNSLESIQAILACAMYSIRSPIGVSVWYGAQIQRLQVAPAD
jgi:hypothetical protein